MAKVEIDLEELLSLMEAAKAGVTSQAPAVAAPTKRRRKSTKSDRILSKSLKIVNQKARLKNGKLRKGYTQARIMKEAHKLARKM